jgi:hypothetical protein
MYDEASGITADDAFKRTVWKWCIWSWPIGGLFFFVSFCLIAGFIPPPRENWSAARLAEFYAENRTAIRVGLIGALFSSALLLPFFTVISAEMRKIEGRLALLAPIQWGGAVILVCFFQIICLGWLLSSFRPEVENDLIRATHDYGWLVWMMLIPTYMLQFFAMAIAGFMDKRPHPIWPRWAAYANIWVATTGVGGGLAVFFKSGPLSWNGIIGFWIPEVCFAAGMTMTMVLLLKRFRYEESLAGPDRDPVGAASGDHRPVPAVGGAR